MHTAHCILPKVITIIKGESVDIFTNAILQAMDSAIPRSFIRSCRFTPLPPSKYNTLPYTIKSITPVPTFIQHEYYIRINDCVSHVMLRNYTNMYFRMYLETATCRDYMFRQVNSHFQVSYSRRSLLSLLALLSTTAKILVCTNSKNLHDVYLTMMSTERRLRTNEEPSTVEASARHGPGI